MPLQVPLPFAFHGNEDFEAYHAGPNRQIVETLRMLAESDQGEAFVYVQGNPGLGKTHLVLATCTAANRAGRSAFYLPLGKFEQSGPSLLEGLETYDFVGVDDIDSIAGKPDWEAAFFHFFNRHRDRSQRLLVTATQAPQQLAIRLPDLASRLRWGLTLELKEMDDMDKLEALSRKARSLGFSLPYEVGRFLLSRYPRDLPSLWKVLETLDFASLSEQRKLTIPFLKSYFHI